MVEDLNFHKVKKLFFVIIFFIFFSTNLFAQNLKFKKLVVLNDPWGSSFLNNQKLIITEKSGKIKIIDILQKKAVEVDHNLNFLEHGQGGLLDILYKEVSKESSLYGAKNLFKNSFDEFSAINLEDNISEFDLESINRSMRVSIASDEEEMNKHLSFLANVGSVSPYVGLLGTVWGIMTSFQGLSDATQATINAVAPGISEALIATGMGLFAAIPAVVAFNKFTSESERISQSTLIFAEELASIFYKKSINKK